MKAVAKIVAVGLCAQSASAAKLSPLTRVTDLLKGLSKQVAEEGKTEETLYEKFVCWGTNVISQKEASNAESNSRIQTLTTYIADIDAGRIEFTSERTDLEKDLEQLNGDLEAAASMREKEHTDFLEAKDEMDKAIAALDEAVGVLKEATEGHESGVLLAEKNGVEAGFAQRVQQSNNLMYAVELGQRFLTKGDALYLRRLLVGGGDVPKADWKKLNRKADFKMSYKARSFKIQEVLAKLLQTFTGNLAEATAKEEKAESFYQELKEAKTDQKTAAEEALLKLETETGAAGMSREESADELSMLSKQVENDLKFIQQIKDSLAEKKAEWKERLVLRAGELAAISKAIGILHSDDARDLFKTSLSSQGYSFLQMGRRVHRTTKKEQNIVSASKVLLKAAAGDKRIAALAQMARTTGNFDAVIAAIDSMVATLNAEEAADLETKETCEKDRMDDTRSAALASRAMDEATETITRLTSEIAAIDAEIAAKQEQIKEAEEALDAATRQRADEKAAFEIALKDDQDAVVLVASAMEVLTSFYAENNLMLVQQKKQAPVVGAVVAGEAPPPPPSTWEAPYGGKTGEATGIIATLTMIKEDIEKDITKTTADETKAQAEFDEFKSDTETQIGDLNTQISTLEGTKADKEGEVEENTGDRATKYGELGVVMKKIKDAEPACFYFTINYVVREKNRQIEIDGLQKAKAILEGAVFATPEDPNRVMKPGDALVQRHSKFLA